MFPPDRHFLNPYLRIPIRRPGGIVVQLKGQEIPPTNTPSPSLTTLSSPSPSVTSVLADSSAPKSTESASTVLKPDEKQELPVPVPLLEQKLCQLSLSDSPIQSPPAPRSPTPPKSATAPTADLPTIAATTAATKPAEDKEWIEITMYRFECPWCFGGVEVQKDDVRCGVFRHGQYVQGGLVDPHCPESTMKQLLANKLIIGCGQPFKLLETRQGGKKPVRCSWI
jgi:hypothetical protein